MKQELNGLLLVDKPTGWTSHDLVAEARRRFGMKAVGHCGTLDPLASGLMVLLLGHATKLSDYVLSQDKRYRVRFRLGVTTDSGDRTGAVVSTVPVDLEPAGVMDAMQGLLGDLELPVPIYSAVKIKGQKLYEYARRGEDVQVPVKAMNFYDLKVIEVGGDLVDAEISCGKGGYIRSWVTAVGSALGVGATVDELRRLGSKPHDVVDAVTVERLTQVTDENSSVDDRAAALGRSYVALINALPAWKTCSVKGREELLLRNGQISHDLSCRLVIEQKDANRLQAPVGIKILGDDGDLLGLIEALPAQGLKIRRIFARPGS